MTILLQWYITFLDTGKKSSQSGWLIIWTFSQSLEWLVDQTWSRAVTHTEVRLAPQIDRLAAAGLNTNQRPCVQRCFYCSSELPYDLSSRAVRTHKSLAHMQQTFVLRLFSSVQWLLLASFLHLFFLYFGCYCDMYAVAVRDNFQSATCRKYVKSAEGNLPDYAPPKEMPRQVKFLYVCLCEPSLGFLYFLSTSWFLHPYILQNSFTKNWSTQINPI